MKNIYIIYYLILFFLFTTFAKALNTIPLITESEKRQIFEQNWLFGYNILLDPVACYLWNSKYKNNDMALIFFTWPIRTEILNIFDKNFYEYKKYQYYVPDMYLKDINWGPDLISYTALFLQIIRFHDLNFNDEGFRNATLSLIPLIPITIYGYNILNEDNKIRSTIEYLSNHDHLLKNKELENKSFYNNIYNFEYFKHKNEIPPVTEDLINRVNLYSSIKDYVFPSLTLGITILELYYQYKNNTIFYPPLAWSWPLMLLPCITLPLFDNEFNSYEKYNKIVPKLYDNHSNFTGILFVAAALIGWNKIYDQLQSLGPAAVPIAIIAMIPMGIQNQQSEKIRTIRYIYEMQQTEKLEY